MRRLCWIVTIGYAALLLTVTHLPPSRLPKVRVGDKIEHLGGYAILSGLLVVSLHLAGTSARRALWGAVLITVAVGAIDELTQPIVGRVCDHRDWLADAAGAGLGALGTTLIIKLRDRVHRTLAP